MAVAGKSDIFKPHVFCLYAGLIEPPGFAVSIRTVITRLRRYVQNRDTFEVDELARRLPLDPTRNKPWSVGVLLAHGLQFRRFFDRRVVMDREIGQAENVSRTSRVQFSMIDRRSPRFRGDFGLTVWAGT